MKFQAWFMLACTVMFGLIGCAPPTPMVPAVAPIATQVPTPMAAETPVAPAGQESKPEIAPATLAWPVSTEGYATPEPGLAMAAFESEVTM